MVYTHFHDADLVVEDADLTTHTGVVDAHHNRDHALAGGGTTHTGFPGGTTTYLRGDGAFDTPAHADLAAHDTLGLATQAELDAHAGAADPHTGYVREADANWVDLTDSGTTTLHSHTGGAPPSGTTVEKDLGSTPVLQGKFTITDAGISTSSKVLCWQAPGPYTGKGTRADEAQMQPVNVTAVEPLSGSATVYWETPAMLTSTIPVGTVGSNNERASIGLSQLADHPAGRGSALRLGKVKGNVKFSYVIFA